MTYQELTIWRESSCWMPEWQNVFCQYVRENTFVNVNIPLYRSDDFSTLKDSVNWEQTRALCFTGGGRNARIRGRLFRFRM